MSATSDQLTGARARIATLGSRPSTTRRRRAFTLVELLVVIGIISLLISILLPSLNKARQHAKAVQCLSNLRNIGQAGLMYASNFKNTIAFQGIGQETINGTGSYNDYWFGSGFSIIPSNRDSTLWGQYGVTQNIIVCPLVSETTTYQQAAANSASMPTSYGVGTPFTRVGGLAGIRLNKIHMPTETVMMADISDPTTGNTNMASTALGFWDPLNVGLNTDITVPAKPNFHGRHGGLGGVLWFDGHATMEKATPVPPNASLKTLAGTQLMGGNLAAVNAAHIGFLVRNPSDLNPGNANADYYFMWDKAGACATNMADLQKMGFHYNP